MSWLYAERWLLLAFAGALIVRLHWNLYVHPPGDYVYSDMGGYVSRAGRLLRVGLRAHEYSSFFPFGTHWLLAAARKLPCVLGAGPDYCKGASFTPANLRAFAMMYAVLGALTVAMAYAVARRASGFWFVAPAVALLGIFYYPHFSLGGYFLSEPPYAFFLMASLLFALRLADRGSYFDATMMGVCCAVGATFRPQLLLSGAAVGLYWILRRKSLPKIRLAHLLVAGIPLMVVLALSAALLHHNTGRRGLLSENGSFNLVFGRCHNSRIESLPDGHGHGKVHFRPPPFLQLNNAEKKARKTGDVPKATLDPAIDDTLSYKGYIGDREIHMDFVRECVRRTGLRGQLGYAWTNALLLWRYNIPWPDSGKRAWRSPATWWTLQHRVWLAVPALLGLVWIVLPGPRNARRALVAINLLALVILAAVYFGGIRHRSPYDFVIIFLAFESYAVAGQWLWRWVRAKLGAPTQV